MPTAEHVRLIIRDHGDMSSRKYRCALVRLGWERGCRRGLAAAPAAQLRQAAARGRAAGSERHQRVQHEAPILSFVVLVVFHCVQARQARVPGSAQVCAARHLQAAGEHAHALGAGALRWAGGWFTCGAVVAAASLAACSAAAGAAIPPCTPALHARSSPCCSALLAIAATGAPRAHAVPRDGRHQLCGRGAARH